MDEVPKIVTAVGGWPIAIVVIGIAFFLIFRAAITEFIGRTKAFKAGKDGLSTEAIDQQRAEVVAVPATNVASDEAAPAQLVVGDVALRLMVGVHESPYVRAVAADTEQGMRERGLDPTGESARVLLQHFAAAMAYLQFEEAYYGILGSQIAFLKEVNQGRLRTWIDATSKFAETSRLFPSEFSAWSVDNYLAYLFTHSLIRRDGDIISITVKGSDFLVWMARHGRNEQRAY